MAIKYEKALKNAAAILAECQALAPTVTAITVTQNSMDIETSDLGLTEVEILALAAYNPNTIKEVA